MDFTTFTNLKSDGTQQQNETFKHPLFPQINHLLPHGRNSTHHSKTSNMKQEKRGAY